MTKKSVTVITIYDPYPNYGNRLQNYAVQEVLRKFNMEVVTLSFERSLLSLKTRIKYFIQFITRFYLSRNNNYWKSYIPKVLAFNRFNKRYIKTKYITKIDEIEDSDYFIVGSDQVWNPMWYNTHPLKKELFLLTFVPDKKKVCFSPSFGISQLPEKWILWFRTHLSSFQNISVRESAGACIVKELIGKDATVLIDPTLMLNREEWRKISKKPCCRINIALPYILTYFLGNIPERAEKDIRYISTEKNFKVLQLMEYATPALYASSPEEFIYLLDHAELVLTDSFHACVFAFLFGKPFLAYEREGSGESMMSRMDTLFDTFDLKRKYVNSGIKNEIMECDYEAGYKVLQMERQKVINFLKKSMDM